MEILIFKKKNGEIDFQSGYTRLNGNKNFSSTNGVLDKDVMPYDDIEIIFYILIFLLNGWLPLKPLRKL